MQLDNFFSHYNIGHMFCMCDKGIEQCNIMAVGTFSDVGNCLRNLLKSYFW
jgi:hypothetical protein